MLTILKFGADWCGPCQALQPTWEKLQNDLKDQYLFQTINIDDNPQLRADYNIRTIPTLIVLNERKEIGRRQGGGTRTELEAWINESRNLQPEVLPE